LGGKGMYNLEEQLMKINKKETVKYAYNYESGLNLIVKPRYKVIAFDLEALAEIKSELNKVTYGLQKRSRFNDIDRLENAYHVFCPAQGMFLQDDTIFDLPRFRLMDLHLAKIESSPNSTMSVWDNDTISGILSSILDQAKTLQIESVTLSRFTNDGEIDAKFNSTALVNDFYGLIDLENSINKAKAEIDNLVDKEISKLASIALDEIYKTLLPESGVYIKDNEIWTIQNEKLVKNK
jgi:hypothetical protein